MKTHIQVFLFLIIALSALSGCATVDPKPFSEFSLAVQEFRDGADVALSINNELNRERYVKRVAAQSMKPEGVDDVMNLLIDVDKNDPFSWKMNRIPLFMASKRFQRGVYTLNSSLVAYADLLKTLSAPETVSQEKFDDLARDLDARLTAAAIQLEFEKADKGIAMFSAAATQAAHSYIDNKRSNALEETLIANQENMETIATQLQGALRLAAANLREDYKNKRKKLNPKLAPGAKGSLSSREQVVKQYVVLNEEYVARLEILKLLHDYSVALPNAHRDLSLAIKSPKLKLSSIKELSKKGKQLNKLYKELKDN